eukprot:c11712_g1_i1 orf=1-321(+)
MMDLSLAYVCEAGESPPPICSALCQWAQKRAKKELPVVGQLSLFQVDNGFAKLNKKPQVCPPSPHDNMNPHGYGADDVLVCPPSPFDNMNPHGYGADDVLVCPPSP